MSEPTITSIDLVVFEHKIDNMGTDYNGFNQVYESGGTLTTHPTIFRVHTNTGITGEYTAGPVERAARTLAVLGRYLVGKNPLERERIYNDLKRGLRHTDRTAIGMVDVALWDFAGKLVGQLIYRLLGDTKSLCRRTRARITATRTVA